MSGSKHQISRRAVLRAAAMAPLPLLASRAGCMRWLPGGDDFSLVVIELEGGNDGLNTLIPAADPAYAAERPQLSSVRTGALELADGYALHPAMEGIHGLLRQGLGTVVHGVGYPNPDRSHFRSRDIWHTADPSYQRMSTETTGWLGRAADFLAARGAAVPGISVGSLSVPLMLKSREVVVPSLERIEDYQILVHPDGGVAEQRRAEIVEMVRGAPAEGGADLSEYVGDVARSAVEGAERMRGELGRYRAGAEYPGGALGQRLQLLARVLTSGFGTRLFHLSYGGFDTHSRQMPAHEALLRQLSKGVRALVDDLRAHRTLDRVVILVFSEFGRRVAENLSIGTDHGAAGPVFLFGEGLVPGTIGRAPSLTELDDGDLRATCDFRELYSAVLRRIGVDDVAVLGGEYAGLDPFA